MVALTETDAFVIGLILGFELGALLLLILGTIYLVRGEDEE